MTYHHARTHWPPVLDLSNRDTSVIACPVCGDAMRPQGQGVVSHLGKHVREGKLTKEQAHEMKLNIRGVPKELRR